MAKKVTVSIIGGQTKTYDSFSTIGEVKDQLGLSSHTAMLNGDPTNDSTKLSDFSYVTLAPAVKSGS
jgi:hypothetical protein